MINRNRFKALVKIVFILYVVLVLYFVIFKLGEPAGMIRSRVSSLKDNLSWGGRNYNLVPLRNIKNFIFGTSRDFMLVNLFANTVVFMPIGYLLPLAFDKMRKAWKTLLICFAGIVVCELLQYITFLGVADIDDIILNFAGCAFGYLVFFISSKAY